MRRFLAGLVVGTLLTGTVAAATYPDVTLDPGETITIRAATLPPASAPSPSSVPTPTPTLAPTPVPTPTPTLPPGDPWATPFGSRPSSGPIKLTGAACQNIVIRNKTFRDLGAGVRSIHLENCSNVVIEQVDFINVAEGVYAVGGSNIVLRDARYQNITGPAHDAAGKRTQNLANLIQLNNVSGALVKHNKGRCGDTEDIVSFTGSTRNAVAEDNHFEGVLTSSPGCLAWVSNSGSGIAVGDGSGSGNIARRNVVLNPGQVGIFINGGTNHHIDSNVIIGEKRPLSNVGGYIASSLVGCNHSFKDNRVRWLRADGTVNGFYDAKSPDTCEPDESGTLYNDPSLLPADYRVVL